MALYVGDTSAWNRSNASHEIAERWTELIGARQLAISTPVSLELLYSARGPGDYAALQDELLGLPFLPLIESAAERASATQDLLVLTGQHRGPKPIDLLIAAIADVHGATLLHYDRRFDAIARVTGQPTEWLARRGSLA